MVSGELIHSEIPSHIRNVFPEEADFFKGLPQEDIRALAAASRLREFARGEHVFLQDAPSHSVFVVVSGWVKLYRSAPDGTEATSAVMTRGAVFGENGIFEDTYRHSAQAAEKSSIIEIPARLLGDRAKLSPILSMHIAALLSLKLEETRLEAEHVAMKTTLQRVSCLLLRLTARMAGKGGSFAFPYDKKLAAQQLGMQRETFSRALSGLKALGVTTQGSETRIDDFYKLTSFTCKNCSAYPNRCGGPRTEGPPVQKLSDKMLLLLGGAWCNAYNGLLELLTGMGGEI
jgi:CRP-like cAMP-binding protein